jgi:hypothetical protein
MRQQGNWEVGTRITARDYIASTVVVFKCSDGTRLVYHRWHPRRPA